MTAQRKVYSKRHTPCSSPPPCPAHCGPRRRAWAGASAAEIRSSRQRIAQEQAAAAQAGAAADARTRRRRSSSRTVTRGGRNRACGAAHKVENNWSTRGDFIDEQTGCAAVRPAMESYGVEDGESWKGAPEQAEYCRRCARGATVRLEAQWGELDQAAPPQFTCRRAGSRGSSPSILLRRLSVARFPSGTSARAQELGRQRLNPYDQVTTVTTAAMITTFDLRGPRRRVLPFPARASARPEGQKEERWTL